MSQLTQRVRAAVVAATVFGLVPSAADSACNLIPAAERAFPSTKGSVVDALGSPGRTVTITLSATCDGPAVFDPVVANNVVEVTFQPAVGADTAVTVNSANVTYEAPRRLTFIMPDTDDDLAPAADGLGLTGPATITVTPLGGGPATAVIGPLFQPTNGCDQSPEQVFGKFTVLPRPTCSPTWKTAPRPACSPRSTPATIC